MKKRTLLLTSALTTTVFADSINPSNEQLIAIVDNVDLDNLVNDTENNEIITKHYLTNQELIELIESGELDENSLISTYGVGTPACYEYTTKRAYLTVSNIDALKNYADLVHQSNSITDKIQQAINYAAYLTSIHYPAVSELLSTSNITSWCYNTVRYMTSKGYSKVDTNLKFERFWNGHAYSKPWQPCEAPSTLSYAR